MAKSIYEIDADMFRPVRPHWYTKRWWVPTFVWHWRGAHQLPFMIKILGK